MNIIAGGEYMKDPYRVGISDVVYDGEKYREHCYVLRCITKEVKDLPLDVRYRVSLMLGRAVSAALGASNAIFNPLVDEDKLKVVNESLNDYHTDLEGLTELPRIFSR